MIRRINFNFTHRHFRYAIAFFALILSVGLSIKIFGPDQDLRPVHPFAESNIFGFYVGSKGEISGNNTTSTPLVANDTFAGVADELFRMTQVTVFLDTDQPPATDGLQFQYSTNGTEWQRIRAYTPAIDAKHPNGYGGVYTFPVFVRYFRVLYINGPVNQDTFNLQTIYHHDKNMQLTGSAIDPVTSNTQVSFVRNIGNYNFDLNTGRIDGLSDLRKFGTNAGVGNTFENIAFEGGTFVFPDSAEYFFVAAGGDVDDTDGGAGAHNIEITYLDTNWMKTIDTLTLAGALASDSTSSPGWRVWTARVLEAGSYGATNEGNISIENNSGEVLAVIGATYGRTTLAQWTCAGNQIAYVKRLDITAGRNNSVDVNFFTRANAQSVTDPFSAANIRRSYSDIEGHIPTMFENWILVNPREDIYFQGKRNTGAGDASVSVDIELLLINL